MTVPEPAFAPEVLVRLLDDHEIEFVIVGGYAGIAHGARRATRDIDVVPRWEAGNLQRLCALLRSIDAASLNGPPCSGTEITPAALIDREIMNWVTRHGRIDTLVGIPDAEGMPVGYDQLLSRALSLDIGGHLVAIASLDDVITSKEWARRRKDAEALPELRRLRDAEHPDSGLV